MTTVSQVLSNLSSFRLPWIMLLSTNAFSQRKIFKLWYKICCILMFSFFSSFVVCEVEIDYGLLQAENPKRTCVWFHRVLSGLDSSEHAQNPMVLKYRDNYPNGMCHNDECHPQVLLHNLKNKKMKEAMQIENIFTYDAPWTPKGNL